MTTTSALHPIKIWEKLCKYLEILRLREGYSAHTARAYGSDLMQVFQIKESGRLQVQENPESLSYRIHWYSGSPPPAKPLQDWKVTLSEQTGAWNKLSLKSKKRKWSALKAFLSWLELEEGLSIDISAPSLQKGAQKLPRFLSVDECLVLAKHLLTCKEKSTKLTQQKLLFFLMYGAGLRVSEACGLQWDHILFSEKKLLFKGKGQKERVVATPQLTLSILKECGQKDARFIWGEKPLPERTAYDRIKTLGAEAGLFKPLNPHALRHSYASQLLTSGSDLRILQRLLGHESLAATELYTHLDIDHLARSMENYHPLGSKS